MSFLGGNVKAFEYLDKSCLWFKTGPNSHVRVKFDVLVTTKRLVVRMIAGQVWIQDAFDLPVEESNKFQEDE